LANGAFAQLPDTSFLEQSLPWSAVLGSDSKGRDITSKLLNLLPQLVLGAYSTQLLHREHPRLVIY
jgi:hypothetical protein